MHAGVQLVTQLPGDGGSVTGRRAAAPCKTFFRESVRPPDLGQHASADVLARGSGIFHVTAVQEV